MTAPTPEQWYVHVLGPDDIEGPFDTMEQAFRHAAQINAWLDHRNGPFTAATPMMWAVPTRSSSGVAEVQAVMALPHHEVMETAATSAATPRAAADQLEAVRVSSRLGGEAERLRRAIEDAPHTADCDVFRGAYGYPCSCWKADAL
jgi:hypothetical protein